MSKVRINDLARELEVKSRPILDALEAIGVSGKTHSSSIEEDQAERVRNYFKGDRSGTTRSAHAPRQEPKFDLSNVSKPGDAMRAILERKQAQENANNPRYVPPPAARSAVAVVPPSAARPVTVAPPAVVVARPTVTPAAATSAPVTPTPAPAVISEPMPAPTIQVAAPRTLSTGPAPHRASSQPGRPHRRTTARARRCEPPPRPSGQPSARYSALRASRSRPRAKLRPRCRRSTT